MKQGTVELLDAIGRHDLEAMKAIIASGADVNDVLDEEQSCFDHENSLLDWAVLHGAPEMIRILLDAGAVIPEPCNDMDSTPLHTAVEDSLDYETVKMLLERGGPHVKNVLNFFDYLRYTPLMWAAHNENVEVARLLIEAGADVNACNEERIGDPALKIAVETGNVEIVRLLVEAGADPTIRGWMQATPLSCAKSGRYPNANEILKILETAMTKNPKARCE